MVTKKAKRTKVKTAARGAAKKPARPKTGAKSATAGRAAPKKKPAATAKSAAAATSSARDKYSQSGAPWWKAHL